MSERQRAEALYTFLKEFTQLRTRTIQEISRYEKDGQVIWASDVPRDQGCNCVAWHREALIDSGGDDDEVWLEIRKPDLIPPPEAPAIVRPWLDHDQYEDSSLELPELLPSLLGDTPDEPRIELDEHPNVQEAWDAYIEDYWWPWAERDRREQAVQRVYTDLFSVFHRQRRLGESFEVVFGLGLLSWKPAKYPAVRRHLVATQVSVNFDTEHGVLTVTPASDGARPLLEQDMLDPQHRPDPRELRDIEETLENLGESIWEAGPLDGLLKSWVHSLSARGEYRPDLEQPHRPGKAPLVHLAPALILRRRTERSYIRAFKEIIDQIEAGKPLPAGVFQFVNIVEAPERLSPDLVNGKNSDQIDPHFPLPANDAQREVVRRLTGNQGVLVQGPPGTGKSHTIVNLICHLLANGQRVLVTSHAARALKVLRRMIEELARNIAPLCVVLLGDDRESLLAMEESVQGITTRHNSWTKSRSAATIAKLERELDCERRNESNVLTELREIRECETRIHSKFGYSGTLAKIASSLQDESESLSWIPDQPSESLTPPLHVSEFEELISLIRDETLVQWESAGRVAIELEGLPTPSAFEDAVRHEREAQEDYQRTESIRQGDCYDALVQANEHDRTALGSGLRELRRLIEEIGRRPLPWTEITTTEVLGDFERTWRQLREDTLSAAASISESADWLDANPVGPRLPRDLPKLHADAGELLKHLDAGNRWGFGPFRAKVVKRSLYIRDLRVGGRPCITANALRDLLRRLDSETVRLHISKRWEQYHDLKAVTFVDLVTELEDLCEPIQDALQALDLKTRMSSILDKVPNCAKPIWSAPDSLSRLIETLDGVGTALHYKRANKEIDYALENLRTQTRRGRLDRTWKDLRDSIELRNLSGYEDAWLQASENARLAVSAERKQELLDRLMGKAPKLAGELVSTSRRAVWDERARNLHDAWNWSRATHWLTRVVEPGSERQCLLEFDGIKQRVVLKVSEIAAEKAWAHCFGRMTERERQHLVAWSKAVRSIGKGTGKYAPMHRRNARKHLNEARSAIPAWVMPLHRVAETIKPGSELFDVAIIDEASQSGPEALLLAWLAKKLVVVGDDKQIHPTYAGINFQDVNQLRQRYLADVPHADSYGVNHSFFDLAEIRYKGRIRLREHFRCMPEIIEFSNGLSYRSEPLIPLRQYGAGRLHPTIVTRHVPEGYQKGNQSRSVNPPEADAVVSEIVRISEDDAYQDKTIGVISLVGNAQARSIEAKLLEKLGPQEIERRQIVCGDSYAFQGDERDVIFLSMVSAPGEQRRIPSMTNAPAERRFNVAASRARDQLFLFHSATLSDLNPKCLRHRLLKYCLNPQVHRPEVGGQDIKSLEQSALQTDRQRVRAPPPFESWFELDVFLRIARRGYRVIPQYKVGSYRIDLVVQGIDGSLAVECDGDTWHGADNYEADAARQRDLERCGWTFWRLRESCFRIDPDEAISNLWETLARHEIFPATSNDRGRSSVHRELHDRQPSSNKIEPKNTRFSVESLEPSPENSRQKEIGEGTLGLENNLNPTDGIAISPIIPQKNRARSTGQRQLVLPTHSNRKPVLSNGQRTIKLRPYVEWNSKRQIPDPRSAQQTELKELLLDVIRCEGPIVAIRAYRLINRASGSQRLTRPARRALNLACAAIVRSGEAFSSNPLGKSGQQPHVLRLPKRPRVVLRERGPRLLDELPPDEIVALLQSVLEIDGSLSAEALKRRALNYLGWGRLTSRINDILNQCIVLMSHGGELD